MRFTVDHLLSASTTAFVFSRICALAPSGCFSVVRASMFALNCFICSKRQARSHVAADVRPVRAKNAKAMAGEPEIALSVFTLIIGYLTDREHLTRTTVVNRRLHSRSGSKSEMGTFRQPCLLMG